MYEHNFQHRDIYSTLARPLRTFKWCQERPLYKEGEKIYFVRRTNEGIPNKVSPAPKHFLTLITNMMGWNKYHQRKKIAKFMQIAIIGSYTP